MHGCINPATVTGLMTCIPPAVVYLYAMPANDKPSPHKHLQQPALLPDFCDVRVVFMVVLLVEILALVLTMAIPSTSASFWDNLAFISMLMQWMALLNTATLCYSRRWLNRLPARRALFLSFGLMMSVSLLVSLALLQLQRWMGLDDSTSPLGDHFLLRVMLISAAIYALVLRYFYIQHQWRQNLSAQARAELQALRARIRPHFLFNSMNTIASLISFRPEAAEKAVEDLSDLFRASLQENNQHTVADEIALTQSYLDIEKLRLGERLQIAWQVTESVKNAEIPSLILQPLAENAIYHGIEPLTDGGRIDILVDRDDDHLVLQVSNPLDTGASMPHRKGNRMAQQNIRQRLQLVYGGEATFTANETKQSYTVQLRIPLG